MEEIQDGWYSRQLQCSAEDPSLAGSRLSHEHDTGLASGLTSRSLGSTGASTRQWRVAVGLIKLIRPLDD